MSAPRFFNHNSVYKPEGEDYPTYSLDEIKEAYLKDLSSKGIIATDMDGTMFRNDLGILVFLEKLAQSSDWVFDPEEFSALLVPDTYEVIINLALAGQLPAISPEDARMYLDLKEDCVDLYVSIYAEQEEDELGISHPLVNEFARKMLELDRLGMQMEHVFVQGMKGQLFSRTRFFVGQNRRALAKLTSAAMKSHENGGRYVHLAVHPENASVVTQRVREDTLESVDYDRQVAVIEGVRYVIDELFDGGKGAPVRVVTTNLKPIAEKAMARSPYAELLKQDCEGKSPILASKLERNAYGKMGGRFRRLPVFGDIKRKVLIDLERRIGRKVQVAMGDSISNDVPMMELALRNGGIAIIVGRHFEETREKFKTVIDGRTGMRRRLGDSSIGDRIFYLEDKEESQQ